MRGTLAGQLGFFVWVVGLRVGGKPNERSPVMGTKKNPSLADDLIYGIDEIAAEIGCTPRQAHYWLQRGRIPGGQIGDRWYSLKSQLRARFSIDPNEGGA